MNRILALAYMSTCAVIALANQDDYQPLLQDFAYRAELTEADKPLRRVELSGELLTVLTRTDLGDVLVFDSNDEQMRSWIRRRQSTSQRRSVPLALYEFSDGRLSRLSEETLTVNRDSEGRLEQYSRRTEAQRQQEVISHYIIDLHGQDSSRRIDELLVDWSHAPEQRLLSVRLQASDDLNDWILLRARQNLTHLIEDDERALGQRFTIDTNKKYLRVSLNEPMDEFKIRSVQGFYDDIAPAPMHWVTGGLLYPDPEHTDYLVLPMSTTVPADGVRFHFEQSNQLVKGNIYSMGSRQDTPTLRQREVVQHNVEQSADVEANTTIVLRGSPDTKWWFEPNQKMASMPVLELAMPAYELLFVAGGVPPYTLAWGNTEAQAPDNSLMKIIDEKQHALSDVALVEQVATVLEGDSSRLHPKQRLPLLKWLLWAVLIVVIVLAGRMAYRLYKEIGQSGSAD